jgi:imidazolonepropionase-like amidohydrolase
MDRMRLRFATLTLLLLAFPRPTAAQPGPVPSAAQSERVLYRNATLIDGSGAPARTNMDVLVIGERIEHVAPNGAMSRAIVESAREVDLHGYYLLPGLIDAHVHLATPPNRRQAEAVLRRDLYGGVTAVRDMADDLRAVAELTRASRVGEIAAPDIYYAALMAGPAFFTDPRTVQVSVGGTPGHVPWMQAITDRTEVPLPVAMARGTYATAIKLYAALTAAQAARITVEAHRQHLLVWAHATLYPAKPSEVVAAGIDTISHACLLVREGKDRVPAWEQPRSPALLATFAEGRNPALRVCSGRCAVSARSWMPPSGPMAPSPRSRRQAQRSRREAAMMRLAVQSRARLGAPE